MEVGDPVQNAIVNIVKVLKRDEKIPQIQDIEEALLQRVQTTKIDNLTYTPITPNVIPFHYNEVPPTLQIREVPTTINILCTISLLKNIICNNTILNNYNL